MTAAGLVVFTVSVDDATGTYTVTMDGTNPLDGSSEPFNLAFGSNIAGGNSDLFFIFDSGSTTLVNGVPDGSTIMVFSTAEDEQSDTTSVNTSAFSLGVNTGQDIGVGDADGVPQTQGDDTETLTLTFADPKDPTTVFSVNDITAQAINFIKITFNALTDSEFAIVQLFILADVANTDPSAHSIWIRVQGSSLTGNVDEVVTVTQGDESLNATLLGTTVDAGSETNPYLVDSYGAGVTATVFIEGEFETVEFTADAGLEIVVRGVVGHLAGDRRQPVLDQGAGDFEMELQAVGGLAHAESLIAATRAGRQQFGGGRQIEAVVMPLHEGSRRAERGEQPVGLRSAVRGDVDEAQLRRIHGKDPAAEGPGDELGAEADAEHRLGPAVKIPDQRQRLRQIGIGRLLEGVHRATEHQQRVVAAAIAGQVIGGQAVAALPVADIEPRPALFESIAEGRGAAEMLMLHHEDVHGAGV